VFQLHLGTVAGVLSDIQIWAQKFNSRTVRANIVLGRFRTGSAAGQR
jgi:hypothetical protein